MVADDRRKKRGGRQAATRRGRQIKGGRSKSVAKGRWQQR